MTKEEVKERLEAYPSQVLRRLADANREKAEEMEQIAETAEQIIRERGKAA